MIKLQEILDESMESDEMANNEKKFANAIDQLIITATHGGEDIVEHEKGELLRWFHNILTAVPMDMTSRTPIIPGMPLKDIKGKGTMQKFRTPEREVGNSRGRD